jgi:hypothetical protein
MKRISYLKVLALTLAITVFSCGKDDGPDTPDPVAQTPEITSFSPASGPVGTTVEMNGKNFSTTKADNTVKFNGQVASVQLATTTKLTVTVPNGATDGAISVKVGDKTATSSSAFTVTEENTAPESITLSQTELTLSTFSLTSLQITNLGEFDSPQVVWEVDNSDVIEVDDEGQVFGLQAGTATVTVTIGELTAQCTVTVEPSVFIAGYDGDEAIVWINGNKLFSHEAVGNWEYSASAIAKSVHVTGKDVYVAVIEEDGDTNRAAGWKNDVNLFVSENYSAAHAIAENSDGVLFLGYINFGNYRTTGYWTTEGTSNYLIDDPDTGVSGAYSYGDKIYATGEKWIENVANCQFYELGAMAMAMDIGTPLFPYGSFGKAIYVDETGEHIAGYDYNEGGKTVAKLWTNNGDTEVQFSNGTTNAKALAVHGNGEGLIVVGGTIRNGVNEGWVWIQGLDGYNVKLTEEGISGMVNGVYVHDGSIYAVGYEDHSQDEFIYTPMLWILDLQGNLVEEIQMANNSGVSSEAFSVFVK